MTFGSPLVLLALVLLPVAIARYVSGERARRRAASEFASTRLMASIAPTRPGWRRHVPLALYALALAALIVAAAKPRTTRAVPVEQATVMLLNDVSLRNLIPKELEKGFGFFQSKPATAFSPVAVTADELGPHWHDGKVQLPLEVALNGERFGAPNAGVDMTFSFPELIAHAAKTRELGAGSIIGSGTISNADRKAGSA